jgi:hypothetical protein
MLFIGYVPGNGKKTHNKTTFYLKNNPIAG